MREEIEELVSEIFDQEELLIIRELIMEYSGPDEQYRDTLSKLRYIIPSRPKRPMYYINHLIGFLPDNSRFVVEQSGSYLDLLFKELLYELTGIYSKRPLGENVNFLLSIKDKINPDLIILLKRTLFFNKIAYVPAKHVYGSPLDEGHYFEVDDTIIIALVAVKLGEEVKKISKFARNMCQDLILPGQKPIIGNHPRTDFDGVPIDFKKRLLESNSLILDIRGRIVF